MRYAQRGGYTPAEQQRRERLRLEAAGRFARGDKISEIARDLRVTEGSRVAEDRAIWGLAGRGLGSGASLIGCAVDGAVLRRDGRVRGLYAGWPRI